MFWIGFFIGAPVWGSLGMLFLGLVMAKHIRR